jgi:hypothetical protein
MSRDGFAAGLGRWTPGNITSDENGRLWDGITGKPVEAPWQHEPAAKAKPVEESSEGGGDAGGTEPPRVPGATDIQKELQALKELRRTDPKRYWSDATQQRELDLLRASAEPAGTKAEPASAEGEESGTEAEPAGDSDAELVEVDRQLSELRAARRASRTGNLSAELEQRELALIDRQEVLLAGAEGLSPELVARWRQDGGLAANMGKAVDVASRAGEAAFEEIAQAVDALPDGMSVEIVDQLRLDWPAVRGSEEHRRDVAAARLDEIINAVERTHGVRAGQAVEAAVAKLSPAGRRGIVAMLTGG